MPKNTNVNDNNNGNGNGSDPDKKTNTQNQPFDPTKLSDEDFNKVFDDERLWKHDRFKELNANAKAGKDAADKLKKMEEKELEEKGKHKELAEKYKKEAEEAKAEAQKAKINNAIQVEATKQGAGDLEAVLALINRENVKVDENGNITGTDEAVKGLLEAKPYLKGATSNNPQVNIGSGSQPGTTNTGAEKFTLSQIQDPMFYREHEKEIDEAYRTGNIIDDMGNPQEGPQGPNA
jgi:hypothetical protein